MAWITLGSTRQKRLRELCDEGACVLLSTHVLDTAERLADRVVMISEGAVVVDEKLDREADPISRLFSWSECQGLRMTEKRDLQALRQELDELDAQL